MNGRLLLQCYGELGRTSSSSARGSCCVKMRTRRPWTLLQGTRSVTLHSMSHYTLFVLNMHYIIVNMHDSRRKMDAQKLTSSPPFSSDKVAHLVQKLQQSGQEKEPLLKALSSSLRNPSAQAVFIKYGLLRSSLKLFIIYFRRI